MIFRLVDIGRSKFCGEVRARSADALLRAVGKHLMSSDVAITSSGTVLVGGFRPVGKVEPTDDLSRRQLELWCEESK